MSDLNPAITGLSRTLLADQLLTHAVRESIAALRLMHVLHRRGMPGADVGVVEAVADTLCAAAVDAELWLEFEKSVAS